MTTETNRLFKAVIELCVLALLTVLAPLVLHFDIMVLGNQVGELSLTELLQESLLVAIVIILWASAFRRPDARGFLVLAGGFFACLLARELDAFFDYAVFHGFWFYVALCIFFVSVCQAFVWRESILPPLCKFAGTAPEMIMSVGVMVVMVLSRTMGSGILVWKPVMGASYTPLVKTAIQEGLELYGYLLIFYASLRLPVLRGRAHGLTLREQT